MTGKNDKLTGLGSVLAGALSSSVAKFTAQPFEVLKIRFQLQVEPIKGISGSKYQSLPQAIKLIYREEGFLAFWKGAVATQAVCIVYGGVNFTVFEHLVRLADHSEQFQSMPNFKLFLCGASAGSISTVVVQPIELSKTRIISRNSKGYQSIYKMLIITARKEGFFALYQGMTPGLLEVFPLAGLNFMFYRYFCTKAISHFQVERRQDLPIWTLMLTGAISAILAKCTTYPLDLTRKRLHIQGFGHERQNFGRQAVCNAIYTCIRNIAREETIFGLYKGLTPTLCKSAVTTSIMFSLYDIIKS